MSDPDFSATALVDTLAIHGVGLIGGSLGMAVQARGLAQTVVGIGRDRGRLEAALRLGALTRFEVAETSDEVGAACANADMVVLCTPVANIARDLPAVLSRLGPDAAVTDVGSVKCTIVEASGGDPRFVGSHPMAGSELAGVYAAKPTLFEEAVWALTPTVSTSDAAFELVRAVAQGVGATTRVLSPAAHDEAVAVTSHLPHVLAYALMDLAARRSAANPDLPHLAAGSFSGATRVAASSPDLWTGIARANRTALLECLGEYRANLDQAIAAIEERDWSALEALFTAGWHAKRRWPGQ